MAHQQKSDFVFRRDERVHLNRRGRQFSRLLAAEMCASALVMLDTPYSEVVWRVLATHSIRQFLLQFPSFPCITVCHYISPGVYNFAFLSLFPFFSRQPTWIPKGVYILYICYTYETRYMGVFLQQKVTGQCLLFSPRYTKCSNYKQGLPTFNHRMLTWVTKADEQRAGDRVRYIQVYFWDGRGSGWSYGWRAPCDGVSVWHGVTTIAWVAYCFAVRVLGSHLFHVAATPIVSHFRMAAILRVFSSLVHSACRHSESQL